MLARSITSDTMIEVMKMVSCQITHSMPLFSVFPCSGRAVGFGFRKGMDFLVYSSPDPPTASSLCNIASVMTESGFEHSVYNFKRDV